MNSDVELSDVARGLVACLEGEETFALKEFLAAKSTKEKKMVTTKPEKTLEVFYSPQFVSVVYCERVSFSFEFRNQN
jgi:hypothetical protein